jgi:hypothetical protein
MEGLIRELVLLLIVDSFNAQLGLGNEVVLLDLLVQQQLLLQLRLESRTDLQKRRIYEISIKKDFT